MTIYLVRKIVIYSANTQHLGGLRTLGSGEYAEDKVFDVKEWLKMEWHCLDVSVLWLERHSLHSTNHGDIKDVDGAERGFATEVAQWSLLT